MRTTLILFAWLLFLFTSSTALSQTCTLAGIYKIGPTGNYPTLTAALDSLRKIGVGNNVILELQTTYSGGGEIFPLRFKNIPCIDSTKNITIRPEAGATMKTIASGNPTATIDLDSSRFIKFDGRPGGVGTGSALTINNYSGTAPTIRFRNDASWNSFEYVNIIGVNFSGSSGVVFFGTSNASVSNGNSFNKFINCNITKGAAHPVNCFYSAGSNNKKNGFNEIINCNISDFYASGATTSGIYLGANSTNWKISGNSIYHSIQITFDATARAIYINDTTSSGFVIENNFIGGSAPNCGSSRYVYGSRFNSIYLMTGTTSYTSVQNNTIANIGLQSPGDVASAITLGAGKFRCGDVTGNTIGSETISNSINIEVTDFFEFYGIIAGTADQTATGADSTYIKNNKICGINAFKPSFNVYDGRIFGIALSYQKKGFADISNNTIGNPASTIGINSVGNEIIGVAVETHSSVLPNLQPQNIISNNTIVNLVGKARGITTFRGAYHIVGNTIRNLYDTGGSGLNLYGILVQSGTAGTEVTGNTVHSLTCFGTSSNAITGISIQNCPGSSISRNFVHSFQTPTAAGNDYIGLNIEGGSGQKIVNNMIRLGIDTLGNSVSLNQKIFALVLSVDSAFTSNNTIYIGGSGTNQTASLIAVTNRPGTIINNIIVNNRSAINGSTNNQYAIRFDDPNPNLSNVNFNNYYASGTRGTLGVYKNVAYSTIINWRNATKTDSNSFYYNPNLINPNGTSSTLDLHITSPTPVEGQGTAVSFITDDFDGQVRNNFSPVDIGADAGNFVYQDGDAPVLSHGAFLGQPVISSFVYTLKVTDVGSGVDTNGANKPKMWFRKKYPSPPGAWLASSGNLISGTTYNGIWGFTPDFSGSGLTLNPGDSVEYYFVAQDRGLIPNVGYSNLAGTVHQNVNTQTTAPTSPLRLLIYGIFPDTVYVGTGQLYTSLTNSGGYFQATQSYMVDTTKSNVEVIITSDLSETATYAYTPLHRSGPAITFRTNTPTVKNIHAATGAQNQSLIRMFNTSDLTIDGRVNGSGRYLLFSNKITITGWSAACLEIGVGFKTFTITNVIIENNSGPPQTSNAVLYLLGQAGAPGPTVVRIENNIIRHANGGAGLPMTGMSISATGHDSTIIKNNEISTFRQWGLIMSGSGTTLDRAVIIDGNHFYYVDPISASGSMRVIEINSFNLNYFIRNNFIGGTGPNCSGGPFLFATASSNAEFYGIYLNVGADKTVSIQNNTIKNIRFTQFGYHVYGMYVNTVKMNIGDEQGNIIGDISDPLSFTNKQDIYGIVATGSGDVLSKIENNIVGGLEGNYVNGYNIDVKKGSFQRNKMITGKGAYNGMRISLNEGVVERNEVSGLTTLQDLVTVVGMEVIAKIAASSDKITVARNRISNLKHETTTAATLLGMSCSSGENLNNNQVSLDNNNIVSPLKMIGVQLSGTTNSANARVYYNSIRLGGNSTSSNNSYAFLVNGGGPLANFKNNLLYNGRSGGTGLHFAYGDKSTGSINWAPGANPDNNLYVNIDTVRLNEWRTTGAVSLSQWRTLMGGDTASYKKLVSDLPVDSLFIAASTGNLNINTLSSKSWAVNGKGMPIASISGDFDSAANVRSTTVATGATDIGSDEFNTSTMPPPMRVTGSHNPGSTEFFEVEGRIVASVTWGPGGVLPTLDPARFYSGTWPNDTTNNNTVSGARYMNSYWDIPATGGSNYNYSLTLYYDSSMLGKVTNANTMLVNKRQSGTPGSWTVIYPTIVNTTLKTITINNQTSFSEFTATDSSASFITGAPLPDLIVTANSVSNSTLPTAGIFTAQFTEVNQGTAAASPHQVNLYLSSDNNLTPGLNGDTLLGSLNILNPLGSNSNTGVLTIQLTVPCNLIPGNYYLIFVADGANAVFESNENNNLALSSITITQGLSVPNVPSITASPSATVCSPTTITLTANSANCSSCTYSWNTGENGNTIIAATSGTYTVTATNACGASTANQSVTISAVPAQPGSISGNNSVCQGSSQTYSVAAVSGATSYTWSLPAGWTGTSTTNSITVTVGSTGGTISVKAINSCGSSTDQTLAVLVSTAPAQPGSMSGSNSVCQGSSQTYSVATVAGATSYTWTLPAGWTGTSTTNSITVTVGITSGTISVKANNSCGSSTDQPLAVTINPLPGQPTTITGNANVLLAQTVNYSITTLPAATSYNWQINGGGSIQNGQGTNSISIYWTAAGSFSITVNGINSCGNGPVQTLPVTVSVGTGLYNPDNMYEIKIHPNPSRGEFHLTAKGLSGKKVNIQLLNNLGQQILQTQERVLVNDFAKLLDLKKIADGVYYVRISIGEKFYLRKIVKAN